MKQIIFRNEDRTAIMDYLNAKAEVAKATAKEKECKAKCKELFARLGQTFKTNGITDYLIGAVQVQGKAKAVVYKETTAKGTIDWQAYALSIGGNAKDAEAFRKESSVRTALDWATEKQIAEIAKLSEA
jgi:hypothetical protein